LYQYDDLNRLTSADRGELSTSPSLSISSSTFTQEWGLDGLGNFADFDEDSDGQNGFDLQQDRSVNMANEVTDISEVQGQSAWVTPAYDAAGNMKWGPKPGAETTKLHFLYDAWNRLVAVKADSGGEPGTTLVTYEYDGLNRRIEKHVTAAGGGAADVHCYFNENWQVVEERTTSGGTTAVNQ
jgi:YD repeat-containing protein